MKKLRHRADKWLDQGDMAFIALYPRCWPKSCFSPWWNSDFLACPQPYSKLSWPHSDPAGSLESSPDYIAPENTCQSMANMASFFKTCVCTQVSRKQNKCIQRVMAAVWILPPRNDFSLLGSSDNTKGARKVNQCSVNMTLCLSHLPLAGMNFRIIGMLQVLLHYSGSGLSDFQWLPVMQVSRAVLA